MQQVLAATFLTPLMAALQVPIILSKLTYLVDNPWSVSLARADRAGLILADSLIDRNLGARPITLIGYSIGARVIYAALQELAKRGGIGLIQNVFLFGSPMVSKKDEYLKARTVVSGRFVNAYATNDWILGYLFRATSGGIMRVAGLASIEVTGIENVDVSKYVQGHMAYRAAMPKLLREVGIAVMGDEFAEIEDPDPDNHEARQRKLIDEIEEARRELQDKPEKKGWGWFKRKKAAEKKSWEIYDDRSQKAANGDGKEPGGDADGVLFDVEAIRKEAVELAAQGLEVKQLESTLPALKIDSSSSEANGSNQRASLRGTQSDVTLPLPQRKEDSGRPKSFDYHYDEFDHHPGEEEVTMSFEPTETRPAIARSQSEASRSFALSDHDPTPATTNHYAKDQPPRPVDVPVHKNVWSDEEDEFEEKEMEMTFA